MFSQLAWENTDLLNKFLFAEEEHEIGTRFEVQFQFRTTKDTGVIISTSDVYGYPALGLEMYQGRVSLQVWSHWSNIHFTLKCGIKEQNCT